MTTAIAIYLTGAVAWFGGMATAGEVEASQHVPPSNQFNNATRVMFTLLVTSAAWPLFVVLAIPTAIHDWATSKKHGVNR